MLVGSNMAKYEIVTVWFITNSRQFCTCDGLAEIFIEYKYDICLIYLELDFPVSRRVKKVSCPRTYSTVDASWASATQSLVW